MKNHTKLPNGFGCIKRLSGNRRKPYAAYPSSKSSGIIPINSTQAIGYYEDWYAAYNALVDYNKNLQFSTTPKATFADVYHAFYKYKFEESKKQLAARSRMDYDTAFKNVPSLHGLPFCSIRKADMQKALDECPLGYSSLSNIKKLYSQIYKYALENDIIEKNYAQFVSICQENNIEKGEPFTQADINLFWQHKNNPAARMILIMIYSDSGKKHTPHDCRHTFSWLCDKYQVDDLSKHLLMGHSLGNDVEKAVYGHRTIEELRREINKIDSD